MEDVAQRLKFFLIANAQPLSHLAGLESLAGMRVKELGDPLFQC